MTHMLESIDNAEEAKRKRKASDEKTNAFIALSLRHLSEGTRFFVFKSVQIHIRADAPADEQEKDIDQAIRYLRVLRDQLKAAA